jgi:hypothetical protein
MYNSPRYTRGICHVLSLAIFVEFPRLYIKQDEHNASFISNKSSPTRRYGMRGIRVQKYEEYYNPPNIQGNIL